MIITENPRKKRSTWKTAKGADLDVLSTLDAILAELNERQVS
jgi:hypothetical protein